MAKNKSEDMAKNKSEDNSDFVNPFATGVNYNQFLEAIGSKTPKEYLTGKLLVDNEADLIEWLTNDLQHYQNNLKNK